MRKTYTPEEKAKAVACAKGNTYKLAAEFFDIPYKTIYGWVNPSRQASIRPGRGEIDTLKKSVADLVDKVGELADQLEDGEIYKTLNAVARDVELLKIKLPESREESTPFTNLTPEDKNEDLVLPEFVLHRYDDRGRRFYYTLPDIKFYMGVTSALSATMPMDHHLLVWRCSFRDYEESQSVLTEKADFGTISHIAVGEIPWKGIFMDTLDERIINDAERRGHDRRWALKHNWKLVQNILSFQQWVKEREVEFLTTEMPIIWSKYGLASCIDFPHYMTFNKKRVLCLTDWKTGTGNYRSQWVQLKCYEMGFRESYPQYEDEELFLFNLHPTDWKKTPKYRMINQTGKIEIGEVDNYLKNLPIYGKREFSPVMRASGFLTKDSDPEEFYRSEMVEDIIKEKYL